MAPEGAAWGREVAVEALEGLGQLAHERGLNAEAGRHFERALAAAAGDGALVARALLGLANQGIRAGEDERALMLLGEALSLAEGGGDRILVGRIRNNLGIAHHGAGRFAEALTEFRRALEVRQGIGYRPGMVVNLHNIGDTQMRLGEPGRAWSAFQQSRELAGEIGWELGVVMNDAWLGFLEGSRVLAEFGAQDAALAAIFEGLDGIASRAANLGDPEVGVTARLLQGRLLAACGRSDAARAALELSLVDARRIESRALERDVAASLRALEPPA
jgi:tetratricopeptide (TPR) repeat protein